MNKTTSARPWCPGHRAPRYACFSPSCSVWVSYCCLRVLWRSSDSLVAEMYC